MNIKPKVLAVIPAKGRSTRIPGKNMKDFAGQPLLYHTIEAARISEWVNWVCVSSDCPEILKYGLAQFAYSVPRSDALCQDDTPTDPVIVHAVRYMEQQIGVTFDMIVTLQCTSPIRPKDLIDDCVKTLHRDPGANTVLTVHRAGHFGWMLSYDKYGWFQINAHRRPVSQDLEPNDMLYVENGSVVATDRNALLGSCERVVHPVTCLPVDKRYAIDIDDEIDFTMAESLVRNGVQ